MGWSVDEVQVNDSKRYRVSSWGEKAPGKIRLGYGEVGFYGTNTKCYIVAVEWWSCRCRNQDVDVVVVGEMAKGE